MSIAVTLNESAGPSLIYNGLNILSLADHYFKSRRRLHKADRGLERPVPSSSQRADDENDFEKKLSHENFFQFILCFT